MITLIHFIILSLLSISTGSRNPQSLLSDTNRVRVRRGPGCRGVATAGSVEIAFVNHFEDFCWA